MFRKHQPTATMKNLYLVFSLALFCLAVSAQQRPFPQEINYAVPHLRPQNFTQADLNSICASFYDQWKNSYLKQCSSGSYIEYQPSSGSTVSEAHGYGMMLFAYMAGYDPQAKQHFDKLYQYYKNHPSYLNPKLMAWKQVQCQDESPGYTDAATDGDLDIAFALLLAHKQWGSGGNINYLVEAQLLIDAILKDEINPETFSVKLGDWAKQGNSYYYSTRSSDFIPDHFRSFREFTGDDKWNNVINSCYSYINTIQNQYSPQTGLMPDFIIDVHQSPKPANAHFLEGNYDGHYYYNSCRFPWRIGTDYLLNHENRAYAAVKKINQWLFASCQGQPGNISNGYLLNGNKIHQWNDPAFVSGFTVAAMTDTSESAWFNNLFSALLASDFSRSGYYENSIKLLSLLVISGNYWAPENASAPNQNQVPVADFSYSQQQNQLPSQVVVDASTSYDLDGDSLRFNWDFGNGATANGPIHSTIYHQPGSYTITLVVSDDSSSSSLSRVIEIQDTTHVQEILAYFDVTSDWGNGYCAEISLENKSTQDADNWEFQFSLEDDIYDVWSGYWSKQCESYKVSGLSWNQDLDVNQTVAFGYCANYSDTIYTPRSLSLNHAIPIRLAAAWGFDPFTGDTCLPICVSNFEHLEDFESNSSFWTLGVNVERSLLYRAFALEGNYSAMFKGRHNADIISKPITNKPDELNVSFKFMGSNLASGDKLFLELVDKNAAVTQIKTWTLGEDFQNRSLQEVSENIDFKNQNDSSQIVIRAEIASLLGRIAVDEIDLNTCSFQLSSLQPWSNILTTEIEEHAANDVVLYPNPSTKQLNIKNYTGKAQIFSVDGKILAVVNVGSSGILEIQELPKGQYVIRLGEKSLRFSKL